MKKKLALLLFTASALSLAACGSGIQWGNSEFDPNHSASTSTSSDPASSDPSSEPSSEPSSSDPATSVPSSEPSSSDPSSSDPSSSDPSSSDPSSSDPSSSVPSSSTEANPATRIQRATIPYAVVNEALDLDEYITIEYKDGSTDKDYQLATTAPEITIVGHTVTANTAGTFRVTVTAGTLESRLDLSFVSAMHKELMDFMAPLDSDPLNFTADWYNPDDNGNLDFYLTHYSWEGASVQVDLSDLDKLDMWGDEPVNSVLAELSDGSAYWGSVIAGETAGTYDVEFNPGKTTMENWVRGYGISVDTTAFTETTQENEDGTTTTYLLSDANFAQALTEGATGSRWTFGGGYEYYGAAFFGLTDTDNDGVGDAAQFDILCSNGTYTVDNFVLVLSDLGNTKLDWMANAQADESYLPIVLDGAEIATAFANVAEGGNYTVSALMTQLDNSGNTKTATTGDYLYAAYGCNQVQIVNTYTEDGVNSVMIGTPVTVDETTGEATVGSATQLSGWAAWSDGAKSWYTNYDSETKAYSTAQEITVSSASTADVYGAYINARGYSASGVTAAGVANTNWTSKTVDETTGFVTYAGDCGDNDGETATNVFLGQLLNIFGSYNGGMGTYWTQAVSFTSGNHALCIYSDFRNVTVDPATNRISATLLMYAPFSDVEGNYFAIQISVSNIGTTTNDFSGFVTSAA